MANIAEILIRSRDAFTQQTEQAKREMESLGRSGQSASRQLEEGGHRSRKSLSEAREAASGLSEVVGVHLPRSVSQFLAHSQTIGPILASAFSAVAVVQLIQVLGELPEAFRKIEGAITGWDEASKKAYDHFLEENRKAMEAADDFQVKMIEIGQGELAGLEKRIALKDAEVGRLTKAAQEARERLPGTEGVIGGEFFQQPQPDLLQKDKAEADRLQKLADAANDQLVALKNLRAEKELQGKVDDEQDDRVRKYRENIKRLDDGLENWKRINHLIAESNFRVADSLIKLADEPAKAIIKDTEEMEKLRDAAGEALIKYKEFLAAAGLQLNIRTPEGVKAGEDAAEISVKKNIEHQKEMNRAREDFLRSFREGAGKVWDDFFIQGKHILTSLADLARALFNQIGRTLFQNFATGLLTGGKTGGGGGIGGAITNAGAGIGAKIGLGALFGGGGAAAGAAVGGGASAEFVGPLFAGSQPGIGGALGLGGGAGLLGLGAATIPVVGGIIAAGIFAYMKLRHHTQEAPFSRDLYTESQHMVEFYTSAQVQATRDLRIAIEHLQGIPPDEVVTQGMPLAFQSSNQFRRAMTSTLMDDV